MSVWLLYGYDTDARQDRVREYTSSAREAFRWTQIKRIDFTDSGHGIVFGSRPHKGKRAPVRRRTDHVERELQRIRKEGKR